jgi:hypothetical protein
MRTLFVRFAIPVGGAALAVACLSCRTGPGSTPAPESSSGPVASAPPAVASAAASPDAGATASFPVPRASVDLVLNPGGLPPYEGPTGSVEGTIRVEGPPAPEVQVDSPKCRAAMDTYGKLFRSGSPETPGGPRTLADAVVVVTGYSGFYVPEKNDTVRVTIGSQCAYPSRTIAITYGQRLDITNQSSLLFAPLLDPTMTTALMVAPPHENGEAVKIYPTKAGYFALTDRLQVFVREDLYVFRHPLHAVTDAAGHYRIDGLPAGAVKVGVHHPTVEADAEAPLDVVPGQVKTVDLTLTYRPKAKAKVADAGVLPPRLRLD